MVRSRSLKGPFLPEISGRLRAQEPHRALATWKSRNGKEDMLDSHHHLLGPNVPVEETCIGGRVLV